MHTEKDLEDAIELTLIKNGGYKRGDPAGHDTERALFPSDMLAFVESTQPKIWDYLQSLHKDKTPSVLVDALGNANITVNKNAVPNDPRSPFITSGLRVGTPAITTRGFGLDETVQLTHWMCDVLDALEAGTADKVIAEVKSKVLAICKTFPVYAA